MKSIKCKVCEFKILVMFFLAMQPDVRHVGIKFPHHRKSKDYSPEIKDRLQLQTALPEFHPKNEILHKVHLFFSMCYILVSNCS